MCGPVAAQELKCTACAGAANMILDVLAQMQQTCNSSSGDGHDRMALLIVGKPQTGRLNWIDSFRNAVFF